MTYIGDNTYGENYHVYPNPTTGIFTITGENITGIQIWNAAGGLTYTISSPAVDISSQPDGIYLVKITTNRGTVIKKLIKHGL